MTRGTPNWIMFAVGLGMAVFAAIALVLTEVESAPLVVIGIIGIVFIGASGARLLS